jgi:hypothetical protein
MAARMSDGAAQDHGFTDCGPGSRARAEVLRDQVGKTFCIAFEQALEPVQTVHPRRMIGIDVAGECLFLTSQQARRSMIRQQW